jgi:shikimate kinase / 3-dehydroquinate synthase
MSANNEPILFLYGPPGSGKSAAGKLVAANLGLDFVDLDEDIAEHVGQSIEHIFREGGERVFRAAEAERLADTVRHHPGVVALGGGSLLDPGCRELLESHGQVLCLDVDAHTLLDRLAHSGTARPLLGTGEGLRINLERLLRSRKDHYASFENRLDVSALSIPEAAWQAQVQFGAFRVTGMGEAYDVRIRAGGLQRLGDLIAARGCKGPIALVTDANVHEYHADAAAASLRAAGYPVEEIVLPAGEKHKTISTVQSLWQAFLEHGLERTSTVVALGGGVVSDLAGFAAATYLRGVRWVVVPTSLLGMADAGLGGKTGCDLPAGKNLVGAFYSPTLALIDSLLLSTLPEVELRNGLAEVVKEGILGDPGLFELCARGFDALRGMHGAQPLWDEIVRRSAAVKVRYLLADPYEKGERAALNLGHTLGHAIELASDYRIRHGEAVSIGMLLEVRIAESIGIAEKGLAERISQTLDSLGLPTRIPGDVERDKIIQAMRLDKKKEAGVVRFALPVCIGEVRPGIPLDLEDIQWVTSN